MLELKMKDDFQYAETKQCSCCHKEKPRSSFIKTRAWIYPDGFSDICTDCIELHLKKCNWNWQEVDKLCQMFDLPFIPRILEEMRSKKIANTFLLYSKQFESSEYEPFHWKDYYEKWIELRQKGEIDKELPLIKDDYYADLALRWGKNYDREELIYLENLYNGILSSQNVAGALNHDQAQKLCKISLQIDNYIRAGENIDKLMSSYEKLTKVANFTPQNAKSDGDFGSFGEVAFWLEKRDWLNMWYTDENKDIVDEVMHSWQAFVQRLYTNESGIGEEISNRLEQLKIEREIQQGDMDLAKKGITDSLFDIDEYVDLEQRDNSLHEDFNVEDVLDSETVKV